jgi:hypothetical protein
MSYATALAVALLLAVLVRFAVTVTLTVLFALTVLPQASVSPRLPLSIDLGKTGLAMPGGDQRVTGREPMHDALARAHSRPLLLINYLDRDVIEVQGLPKGGSAIESDCIEVPHYPWSWYTRPQQ